jgi:hypothetical protein
MKYKITSTKTGTPNSQATIYLPMMCAPVRPRESQNDSKAPAVQFVGARRQPARLLGKHHPAGCTFTVLYNVQTTLAWITNVAMTFGWICMDRWFRHSD